MVRLLLVEDHPIVAHGIEAILRGTDYELVRHVRDGSEALSAIDEEKAADIVILDERLPGMTGLEIFRAMRARGDRRPAVFVTATLPERRAIEAIEAGIEGLVLKHAAADALIHCLDEVRNGGRWIDQQLLQRALDHATGKDRTEGPLSRLTERERAIILLVGDNMRNQEIADRIGISVGTVKVHIHNAYRKLGISRRVDLILMLRDSAIN